IADEERFRYAIDVRAARRMRIRPLPLRDGTPVAEQAEQCEALTTEAARPLPPLPDQAAATPITEPSPLTPAEARLDRWKRKLLDLSLRNRLINFRETKQSVRLECPDVGVLEDVLASGAQLDILPRTRMMEEGDPRDPKAAAARGDRSAKEAYLSEELQDR